MNLEIRPITPDRAADLERFSCAHGKFRYCSYVRWRLTSSEYARATKESRQAALEALVQARIPTGVLAYRDGTPIGWCSIAPRETYRALERSRALARLDDTPVWSVVCFFVDRTARRQGLTRTLLTVAVDYAVDNGAGVVEGYPVPPGHLYTYMGSPATFLGAGFTNVTPPGRERLVMRYIARPHPSTTPTG